MSPSPSALEIGASLKRLHCSVCCIAWTSTVACSQIFYRGMHQVGNTDLAICTDFEQASLKKVVLYYKSYLNSLFHHFKDIECVVVS